MSAHPIDRSVYDWLKHICESWGLSQEQLVQILKCKSQDLALAEFSQATVPAGLDCAPPLIQIYKKLVARYPDTEKQLEWLFKSHPDFGGAKPIDVAASSTENLFWLAYYLESATASKDPEAKI